MFAFGREGAGLVNIDLGEVKPEGLQRALCTSACSSKSSSFLSYPRKGLGTHESWHPAGWPWRSSLVFLAGSRRGLEDHASVFTALPSVQTGCCTARLPGLYGLGEADCSDFSDFVSRGKDIMFLEKVCLPTSLWSPKWVSVPSFAFSGAGAQAPSAVLGRVGEERAPSPSKVPRGVVWVTRRSGEEREQFGMSRRHGGAGWHGQGFPMPAVTPCAGKVPSRAQCTWWLFPPPALRGCPGVQMCAVLQEIP